MIPWQLRANWAVAHLDNVVAQNSEQPHQCGSRHFTNRSCYLCRNKINAFIQIAIKMEMVIYKLRRRTLIEMENDTVRQIERWFVPFHN